MNTINIDLFSLDWIRTDKKIKLSMVHPEADAFQKICGSILSDPVYKTSSGLVLNLISFPTEGPDGAIDHYAFTEKRGTTIVECKKNNSLKNSLEEIKKLENKLLQNLYRKNAMNSIYSPWFNKKLERYIFCTSSTPCSAFEYEQLDKAIRQMIQHIGSISTELFHLKSIDIKVYSWQQLKEWIERSAFLMYQWVQPNLEGIEYISNESEHIKGYRSYLSSSKIPYISRDNYMQTRNEKDLPSEKKYLDELIGNSEKNYKGIIIYGEGGIGKTRLMRELSLMAQNDGWQSYKINALVNFKELIAFLRPGGKYILLFDYIEELPEFHDWAENLTQKDRAYEVRIIANCRSSYISNVRILSSSQFAKMDISNSSETSQCYYRDVVNEIIKDIPALKNVNNKIFQYRPSFAVFVRYLYDRDKRDTFDLKKDEDFRAWIIRRLELSFSKLGEIQPTKELLTMLFSCLPNQDKGKEFLENNYTGELNVLIGDGWFEYRKQFIYQGQSQLAVIHDTLSDEVLCEYLERNKNIIEVVVRKFFNFAAQNRLIYGCTRAFERIIDSPLLSNIDFVSIFSKIIINYPEQMKESYYDLVKTSLISERDMISMYLKHKIFFMPFIQSSDFAGPLSFLLNDFSKKEVNAQINLEISEIYSLWYLQNEKSILLNRHVSKIISTSIKFFGPNPREQKHLVDYLHDATLQSEDSYVIAAWLKVKGDKSIVSDYMLSWLVKYDTFFDATYVLEAWLEAGGNKMIIKDHIINWLKLHKNLPRTGFIIRAWLKAEGDKNMVTHFLSDWLKKYDNVLDTMYTIEAWLKAKGDQKLVKDHIINLLENHKVELRAGLIISVWLETTGDKTIVEKYIINWLKQYDNSLEASFVFRTWLESEGNTTIVEPHVINWLKQHATSIDASFVIRTWLEANGNQSIVNDHLSNWLNHHDDKFNADFVMRVWLEVGGNKEFIKQHLINWLKRYNDSLDAKFVISAWLKAQGDKTVVERHVINWLKQYNDFLDAKFVISAWLKAQGDKTVVEGHVINWLKKYSNEPSASFVIEAWLESNGELNIVEQSITTWLEMHAYFTKASHIFQPWLKLGGSPKIIEKGFAIWLEKNELNLNSFYTIGLWLKKGGELKIVRFYVGEYIEKFSQDLKATHLLNTWMDAGGEIPIRW